MTVHVIGAGLAGLAAACTLAERGVPVVLHEAAKAAGGRCRSYFDAQLGCRIDNGNHLLLSGNKAAMDFLRRIGTLDTLTGPAEPIFPFINLATGAAWTLRLNRGRLPWWIFAPTRRVPGTKAADYLALLKLRRAARNDLLEPMIGHTGALSKNLHPALPRSWPFGKFCGPGLSLFGGQGRGHPDRQPCHRPRSRAKNHPGRPPLGRGRIAARPDRAGRV
jgi:phytoene dehydrogenase-like protein